MMTTTTNQKDEDNFAKIGGYLADDWANLIDLDREQLREQNNEQ